MDTDLLTKFITRKANGLKGKVKNGTISYAEIV